MASSEGGGTWLVDSNCSNHMSGDRSLFDGIEESPPQVIRLGDDNILIVAGVGTVTLRTTTWKSNTLTHVKFMPNLTHNLLSVGKFMLSGYKLEFTDGECTIKIGQMDTLLVRVQMTSHSLFSLGASNLGCAQVVQGEEVTSKL